MIYILHVGKSNAKYPGQIFSYLVKGVDKYENDKLVNSYFTKVGEVKSLTVMQRAEIRGRCGKWCWDNDTKKVVVQPDKKFHKELDSFDPLEA